MWNDCDCCDCQRAMDRSHYWVSLDDPSTDSNFWGMPSAKRRRAISVSDVWKGPTQWRMAQRVKTLRVSRLLHTKQLTYSVVQAVTTKSPFIFGRMMIRRRLRSNESVYGGFSPVKWILLSSLFHSDFHSLRIVCRAPVPHNGHEFESTTNSSPSFPILAVARSGLSYFVGRSVVLDGC
jgi:hypothetical protein